jgi:hypothetical protein
MDRRGAIAIDGQPAFVAGQDFNPETLADVF